MEQRPRYRKLCDNNEDKKNDAPVNHFSQTLLHLSTSDSSSCYISAYNLAPLVTVQEAC